MPSITTRTRGDNAGDGGRGDDRADRILDARAAHATLLWLGLASLWLCLQASGFYPLSLVPKVKSWPSAQVAAHHLVYTVALVVLAVGAMAGHARVQTMLESRTWPLAAGALGLFGHVLLGVSAWQPQDAVVVAAGALCIAAFIVAMTLFWAYRLVGNGFAGTMLLVAVSYVVSQVVCALYFALGLPQGPLLAVCALVSCACAFAVGSGNVSDGDGAPQQSLRKLPWGMMVPMLFLVYFCEIFIRLRIGAFSGDVDPQRKMITSVVAGLAFLAITAILLMSREREAQRSLMVAFAVLVVGYLIALLVMLFFDASNRYVTNRVLIACSHCVEVLLWMVVLDAVTRERISAVSAFGFLIIVALAIPWAISFDAYYLLGLDAYFGSQDILMGGVAIGIVVAAASAIAFLLRYAFKLADAQAQALAASEGDAGGAQEKSAEPARRMPVRETLAQFGLTNRENEVAEYLYRGYSAKKIADILFLSEASIRAHTSHIYRKMGIHSKQELISYIDDQD